jgi:hypothetical protein
MNPEGVELRMDAIQEVDQHTDEVLREIGYDATGIAAFRATRAVSLIIAGSCPERVDNDETGGAVRRSRRVRWRKRGTLNLRGRRGR